MWGPRGNEVHMVFQVILGSEGPRVRVGNLGLPGPRVPAVCPDTRVCAVTRAHQDRWANKEVLDHKGPKALQPERPDKWSGR